jgi:uncharacterized SAM-binding protein YcdF (DUF218 family)
VGEGSETGGRVVAVLGYSRRRGAGLDPICAERLAHAETLAGDARAVILSGWARRRRASSEADAMRSAWSRDGVPLVCDADARSTAENAANVVAAASALGADELVVVTSGWHRLRTRFLLAAAARGHGLRVSVVGTGGRARPGVLARELACLALAPTQLRRARRGGPPRPVPRRSDGAPTSS